MTQEMAPGSDVVQARLDSQIAWYDERSARNKKAYWWMKGVEIVVAAFIPFCSAHCPATATGLLGVVVVILEGLQHAFNVHENWINYRSTAEALKHEKYLFASMAGPYAQTDSARVLLAERVEGLASQGHAKWVVTHFKGTPKTV